MFCTNSLIIKKIYGWMAELLLLILVFDFLQLTRTTLTVTWDTRTDVDLVFFRIGNV